MEGRSVFNRRLDICRVAIPLVLLMGVVVMILSPVASGSTGNGVVEFLVFNNPDCVSCVFLDDEMLPALKEKYGSGIEYEYLDIREFDNVRAMIEVEDSYGRTEQMVPQVYIGGDSLIGEEEIRGNLEAVIEKYVEQGGVDMPNIPEGDDGTRPPPGGKPVYVTYFYSQGCGECDPVALELQYIKRYFSNVELREYDTSTPRGMEFNEAMCEMAGVPTGERGVTPCVFVGERYLVGDKLHGKALQTAVEAVRVEGTENTWESAECLVEIARRTLRERLSNLAIFPVLGAGLIDGFNPCAFTVIVFFISYLAFVGRRGRDILLIGIVFAASVLLTYFLIGLGLLSFVRYLGAAGRWVTLGVAVLAVLFGVVSLYDYLRGRKEGEARSTLGLPRSITRRIHQAIREKTKTRRFIAAAAVLGVIIASLELGCTGQVYLPTITFVARSGGDRAKAVLFLAAYNLMFIVPLLVVFAVAYAGTGSEKLVEFGNKHTNGLKLMMSVTFFAMAALLFATM